jgi:heme o synthase
MRQSLRGTGVLPFPAPVSMQAAPGAVPAIRRARAVAADYWSLAKPRVVLFHLVTAASAMILAAGGLPGTVLFAATLAGGGLVAGASNILNGYFDRDIDRLMPRTAHRPLAAGRIRPSAALIIAGLLFCAGVWLLAWHVNWQASLMAATALVYYVLVYTIWLKRRTYWGSIVGSAAGAFPPLIGWIAVTGHIGLTAILLFAVVVLWTLPHFWALAIWRGRDYSSAGLGMIPSRHASLWILVSALLLTGVSLVVGKQAAQGLPYLISASLLDLGLLFMALRLQRKSSAQNGRDLFIYSNLYLVALFMFLLVPNLI